MTGLSCCKLGNMRYIDRSGAKDTEADRDDTLLDELVGSRERCCADAVVVP